MNNRTEGQETIVSKILKNKKRIFPIVVAAAAFLAVLCGIGIYNKPENRLNRHLEMANKYLEETNYEQAIVEFDRAIAIDPMSAAAYIGKAEAYVGLDDYDMAIETLETGYLAVQKEEDIRNKLIAVYIEALENSGTESDYEEKLRMYDRLIELEGYNASVLDELEKCLEQYINLLMNEGKSDEVREIIDKYKDILAGTDFDAFSAQIEMRMKEIGYGSLLSVVQDLIVAENYDQVNVLVQTEEYQEMISSLQEDNSYYYGEKNEAGKRNGMGIAIYQGHYGEYFYYGEWSEGERSGQGLAFHPTPDVPEDQYGIYIGEWAYDLPNGEGEERNRIIQSELKDLGIFSLYRGSYKDGLYNGEMYIEVIGPDTEEGNEFGYRGTAENGVWKLQGEIVNGKALIWVRDDNGEATMWMDIEDNKDEGVRWLFPSSYWVEN